MSDSEKVYFCCYLCSKLFASQGSLTKHQKTIHMIHEKKPFAANFEEFNNKCLEEDCRTSYRQISHLRCHLETFHNWKIEKEEWHFSTKEEFEIWFSDTCEKNNLQYFRREETKKNLTYFNCYRSGKVIVKSVNRQRKVKSQGSCKLGINCVSQIILKKNSDNTYFVTYYKTHYGHSTELQHLTLSNQKRLEVASYLAKGLSENEVFNMYRKDQIDENVVRSDFITKKDIRNIKIKFFKGKNGAPCEYINTVIPDAVIEEEIEDNNNYNTEDIREEIRNKLNELQFSLEICNDAVVLPLILDSLKKANSLVTVVRTESGGIEGQSDSELCQEEPPNKKSMTQSLFYSGFMTGTLNF
ncbi:unnamed protein product [Ceutorhynchus assimilis]|uniref:C2H2-type domain-containing protein n=1 Tax=Ceutorhynchus assimilis TaxID=467358 RepID=A0A9N9MHW0_9CUCU|nr:unnamed protein product [Ceutorhynchus assimilis]